MALVMRPHGGGCCGMRHISGFTTTEDNNPDLIDAVVATVPPGRTAEVILNQSQVRNLPNVMARLAQLGFVLIENYVNDNTNYENYVFHRTENRRALLSGHIAGRWNGMISTPSLNGDMPEVRRGGWADLPRMSLTGVAVRRGTRFQEGNVIYVADNESDWYNSRGVVILVQDDFLTVRFSEAGPSANVRRSHCAKVAPSLPPVPANRYEGMTHAVAEGEGIVQINIPEFQAPAPVAPPPAPPAPTVVFSTWHRVYRDGRDGRVGLAGYGSLRDLQAKWPDREIIAERRDIWSDGDVVNTRP